MVFLLTNAIESQNSAH